MMLYSKKVRKYLGTTELRFILFFLPHHRQQYCYVIKMITVQLYY